jgi:hypothetical protein
MIGIFVARRSSAQGLILQILSKGPGRAWGITEEDRLRPGKTE